MKGELVGPSREIKKKMSPPKVRYGAQGACSVIELDGLKELKGLSFSSLSPKLTEIARRIQGRRRLNWLLSPTHKLQLREKKH